MKNTSDRNDKIFDLMLEEAFEKHAEDLAAYEPECEMTDEEIRLMESRKDKIYNNIMKEIKAEEKKKKGVPLKILVPLVAVMIFVLAYSFNTFAFRTFLNETLVSLIGTDLNFNTKKLMFEDYNTITNFDKKDEIIVPAWLPDGMELEKIKDDPIFVVFNYKSEAYWLTLRENADYHYKKEMVDTDNNDYTVRKSKILNMDAQIVEITVESGITTYLAYWNNDNINYNMTTNLPEEEFNKVLKNLQYLEE